MEKSNQQRLEEYLVGTNGYLKKDISNGKVIMLSGKWGSGKTFFWKNIIATDEFKKELSDKNSAYSYVSLYGKSSIEEIENDIFAQIYFSAIGGDNLVTKTFSTFTKYSKRYGNLFSSFDFSKLAEGLENEQKDNKERVALERLKNGAIICFDDFERKSKDIDLNDLFGFITNLTIEFDCKVVIILNDDVFEGEEKDVFSRVKEKSVSKFLKYEPSIKELFETIFNSDEQYRKLDEHKQIILQTIEETKELNARIYIQVLDNLVEWIDKKQETDENILRCLILVNINFILFHTIFYRDEKLNDSSVFNSHKILKLSNEAFDYMVSNYVGMNSFVEPKTFEDYIAKTKKRCFLDKSINDEIIKIRIKFIEDNLILFKSDYFANKLNISKNVNDETFQKINNFIETGILI
ncbi:MAG: P-loop NTPase fold protein [Arcobacter sp.]|jgi:hypothetical protein|uniref:P-loop NTPase fold protein n=1 Tax=Arcobacter sp. TaxID=1872629 RepID=UPI002583D556|nr:P-loop NTPase fold protein [Arcobacter sp.]MDD3008288.1 P-loop NTPase fold protein [Arcobacter sp.]MDY3204244.1 P-loop NTPase fold protein [Arcobacter sp.]